jgi:hypothetical protein
MTTNNNARVIDGTVIEVCSDEALATHVPSLQEQFHACPANVAANWTFVAPSTWTAPVSPMPPPATTAYAKLTPIQYYNAFTVAEAIAIKTSTDPVVQEIWYRLQTAITASGNNPIVDPNSTPVQAGLTYLSTTNPPLIQPSRIPQICAGVAQ